MSDESTSHPAGLSPSELVLLRRFAEEATGRSLAHLEADVQRHWEQASIEHSRNRCVNIQLATAIKETIETVIEQWDDVPSHARSWLAAACVYFANNDDDEPDFTSPIGFEDDAEILNACLRYAGMSQLCLCVEDYDGDQ